MVKQGRPPAVTPINLWLLPDEGNPHEFVPLLLQARPHRAGRPRVKAFKLMGNSYRSRSAFWVVVMVEGGGAFPGFRMTPVVVLANYASVLLNTCFQFPPRR